MNRIGRILAAALPLAVLLSLGLTACGGAGPRRSALRRRRREPPPSRPPC